jgi:hypothetical protein
MEKKKSKQLGHIALTLDQVRKAKLPTRVRGQTERIAERSLSTRPHNFCYVPAFKDRLFRALRPAQNLTSKNF